jgi:CheY-like chemotaxis protein
MDKIALLLVDDDEVDREMIARALAGLNIEIDEAIDGATCLEHINTKTYDLILLDYRLPDIVGIELAKKIKKLGITAPIILVTGFGTESIENQGKAVGLLGYILKSEVTPGTLTKIMLSALTQHNIDIIEKSKNELKLFNSIFNSISDGTIVVNPEGEFLFYNTAAVRLMGLESFQKTLEFTKYFNLYKIDKITPWPSGKDPLSRALEGTTTVGEILFAKTGGKWTLLSCMAVPLVYESGDTGGLMMFRELHQITDMF